MEYQYIIRIPFEALDDAQARDKTDFIAMKIGTVPEKTVIKLQRLVAGKEPEGIKNPPVAKETLDYFKETS